MLSRTKFGFYSVFGMWVPLLHPSATDATIVQDSDRLDRHQEVVEATIRRSGCTYRSRELCRWAQLCRLSLGGRSRGSHAVAKSRLNE